MRQSVLLMSKKVLQVRKYGRWETILPQRIQQGNIFRIIDETGNIVSFPDKDTWKVAGRDAVIHFDGSVVISWEGLIKF